ncbi:MAG: hypothetical protein HYZ21_08075 [Chloroflexi bacterium]|nr:hypothetical protein [Chloroflexota bacterium]
MRLKFPILTVLLSVLSVYGFAPIQQTSGGIVTLLNRENQPASQITDGDSIQIQVTLPQPVTQTEKINFSLDGALPVGSCAIASEGTSCITDPFLSLGWYWDANGTPHDTRTIQAVVDDGEIAAQSNPIRIFPRPVVMVHGFISNSDAWKFYLGADGFLADLNLAGFAIGDGQVPGKLETGSLLNPVGRTNTIKENAEILGEYISGVKQKTGAEMVDLVVHSMGGMISRYYIDRVMRERDVAQLIMLGSPMGGSDCSVLPAALGFYLPASIEIRESYMTGVFNQQITRRHGIEFFDLGGTAINEAFKSPCTDIPNDTVVSFGSINAIKLQSAQINVLHNDLTFSDETFQDYVKPLLQRPADAFLSAPDPAPVPQAESSLQFTRVYTGHVDAGGSIALTINIDPNVNVAGFALYDTSRSMTTVVRGASGNIIELDPQTNGFIRIDDPTSLFYLGYGFENPKPGPWNITLQASESTPSSGADFAISVYFVGGATLVAESSTLTPQVNETVEFTADLSLGGLSLEIQDAKAVIQGQDGNIETLSFPTGRQISTSWTPHEPGVYAVDIIVTGSAPDGSVIERTGFLAIEVQPNPGKALTLFNVLLVIVVALVILAAIVFFLFNAVRLFRRATKIK